MNWSKTWKGLASSQRKGTRNLQATCRELHNQLAGWRDQAHLWKKAYDELNEELAQLKSRLDEVVGPERFEGRHE